MILSQINRSPGMRRAKVTQTFFDSRFEIVNLEFRISNCMKQIFLCNVLCDKFARMKSGKSPWFLLLSLLCLAPAAVAQDQGTVDGRVVNGTNGNRPAAGISVDAVQPAGGMTTLKSVKTDADGKFHFDGLPTMGPMLVRVDYKDVTYFSPAMFDERGKAKVEMSIYEPTTSMEGVRLASLQMAFKLAPDGLRSIESYAIDNESNPPRAVMRDNGNFRFSKVPGITEPPNLNVTSPGSNMPVTQAPLESADGKSYYSLYSLKPGTTTFEVSQVFPYQNGSFTFRKTFYQEVKSLNVGVIPQDMKLSGPGLVKVQSDAAQNFAVYSIGPIKAGSEVVWTFSGGAPVADAPAATSSPAPDVQVKPMPNMVAANALIIGPLLLFGLILVLWYANRRFVAQPADAEETRMQELSDRREQLLSYVANLDAQFASQKIDSSHYSRLREQAKRHLRRIALLLGKK